MGRLSHPFAVSYIVKKQGNNNYQINNKNNNNNNNKNNNKDSNNINNNKINANDVLQIIDCVLNSFLTIVGSWYLTNKVLHSVRKEESRHKGRAQFMDVQYLLYMYGLPVVIYM